MEKLHFVVKAWKKQSIMKIMNVRYESGWNLSVKPESQNVLDPGLAKPYS